MPAHLRFWACAVALATVAGVGACDSGAAPPSAADARLPMADVGPEQDASGAGHDAGRRSSDARAAPTDAAAPGVDVAWSPADAIAPRADAAWVPVDAAWGPADAALFETDAAWVPADVAWFEADAAVPTLDVSVSGPNAAWVPTPDAAWVEPDAAMPTLDLSVPEPDAAAPPSWERPLRASDLPPAQLNVGADTWRAWLFADMIRGASPWVKSARNAPPLEPAAADALGAELRFDGRGWPTNLPATAELEVQVGYSTGEAFDPETNALRPSYLHGVFVLTWSWCGTVDFLNSRNNGQGYHILRREPGRIVLRMDSAARHPVLRIADVDPADPVRDVHLWAPAADGAGLELTEASELSPGRVAGSLEPAPEAAPPLFHPVFLAHLAEAPDAGVLRFLT